jgi:hypothetical protein
MHGDRTGILDGENGHACRQEQKDNQSGLSHGLFFPQPNASTLKLS